MVGLDPERRSKFVLKYLPLSRSGSLAHKNMEMLDRPKVLLAQLPVDCRGVARRQGLVGPPNG